MSAVQAQPEPRFAIICCRCERMVLARRSWVGREVECPHCFNAMVVPEAPSGDRPVRAEPPRLGAKQSFAFACPGCGSMLEAHTGLIGLEATCPTCAARLEVPSLRWRSGKPRRAKLLERPSETPAPVHAYGAAGHDAPEIVNLDGGGQAIRCPGCGGLCSIEADACPACDTPFTMQAAATVGGQRRENLASWSLTLGLLALLAFPFVIPGLAALWFGTWSLMTGSSGKRTTVGIAGAVLGAISLCGAAVFWYWKLKP